MNSSTLLPGTWPGGTLTLTVMSLGGSVGAILLLFGDCERALVDYELFMVFERTGEDCSNAEEIKQQIKKATSEVFEWCRVNIG